VSVPTITLAYASGTLDNNGNGRMYADAAKFVYVPPPPLPAIVLQPQDTAVKQGENAMFSVTAENNPAALSYFWRFEGVNIPGATGSSYTIQKAQPAHEGEYSVVITNVSGIVTSTPALLTVYAPPYIASQPVDQTVAAGEDALFEVTGGGTEPFHYQWRFNGNPIEDETGPTLAIPLAMNTHQGGYSVIITNVAGAVTSSVANLTVTYTALPQITGVNVLPDNAINLEFVGGPGAFIIEASPDLAVWTNRASVVTTNGTFSYQDATSGGTQLFYRVKREP
jgi:hypothetical protein